MATTYNNNLQEAQALQAEIARQNGGRTLELSTILAWLGSEGQAPSMATSTNPLNIPASSSVGGTYYSSRVAGRTSGGNTVYTSNQAGIEATAYFLLHVSHYSSVVATMAPAGSGNPVAQATAIQNSPWAASHYGYALVSRVQTIIAHGVPTPSGNVQASGDLPGSGPTTHPPIANGGGATATLASSPQYTADQWNQTIACVTSKHPTSAGHQAIPIDASWIPDIIACASSNGITLTAAQIAPFVGKSMSDLRDGLAQQGVIPPADVGAGIIPNINFDALNQALAFIADAENWAYILALVLGVPMFAYGAVKLSRGG